MECNGPSKRSSTTDAGDAWLPCAWSMTQGNLLRGSRPLWVRSDPERLPAQSEECMSESPVLSKKKIKANLGTSNVSWLHSLDK